MEMEKNFTISVFPTELKKELKILAAERDQKIYEAAVDCIRIGLEKIKEG